MKKRFISFFVVLMAVVLAFSACRSRAADGERTLVVALPSFPVSLDNTIANEFNSLAIHYNFVETLVTFDGPERNIVPSLAESWHMPDPQTVIMNLRRGIKFHNGDEMKASDVQFSIMRGVPSAQVRILLGVIDSVDIINDYSVQINLNVPFAPILAHLTHPGAGINSERAFRELGAAEFANQPVGTGPFKFSSMSLGDYVELEKFEDYWGTPPGVDRIRFVVIPESTNRLIEVETGGVHISYDIAPHNLPRLRSDPNLAYDLAPVTRIHFMGFNLMSPTAIPLRDLRVRQAIYHAVDIQALVDTVYQGVGKPLYGPLAGIAGVLDFEPVEFNPARARQLLAEAGYPNGFSVSLWCTSDNQQEVDTAIIIQNMLGQVGINVEIVTMEFAIFLSATRQSATGPGGHDMYVLSWNNMPADPDYGLVLFHSNSIGGGNRFHYSNPALDRILDEARAEINPARRTQLYEEAQRILVYDKPLLFILHGEELCALSPNITGFVNFPPRVARLNTVRFTN